MIYEPKLILHVMVSGLGRLWFSAPKLLVFRKEKKKGYLIAKGFIESA